MLRGIYIRLARHRRELLLLFFGLLLPLLAFGQLAVHESGGLVRGDDMGFWNLEYLDEELPGPARGRLSQIALKLLPEKISSPALAVKIAAG